MDEIHLHLGLLEHWTAVVINQRYANQDDDSFTTAIGRLSCRQRLQRYAVICHQSAAVAIPAVKPISVRVPRSYDNRVNVMPPTGNKDKAVEIRLQQFLRPRKTTVIQDRHGSVKGTIVFSNTNALTDASRRAMSKGASDEINRHRP